MHNYITKNGDRSRIYFLLALISIALGYCIHEIFTSHNIQLPWWFEIPSIPAIYGLAFILFDLYIWKIPILRKMGIVYYPDISGTYKVSIYSSFDKNNKYIGEILIKQTWTKISICLETEGSRSYSEAGSFFRSRPDELILSYSYINEPKSNATETMNIHRGAAMHFINLENLQSHSAEYFTGRGRENFGSMDLSLEG